MAAVALTELHAGQLIPFGGDRAAVVTAELAAAFVPGDRLVVVHETGDLLHIPQAEHARVDTAVGAAQASFADLATVGDEGIAEFFDRFAAALVDDDTFASLAAANVDDVQRARSRGRSTTRLELTESMRRSMIAGLQVWRDSPQARHAQLGEIEHSGWRVATYRAPLGVVGFVFEGRPNVFADATGVLRSGNTVVLRIGSDALGSARAIMEHAVRPALRASGLPEGCVQLVDSTAHAAGWALFADQRLALAVARGSGAAVAQLGAVARQHGVPASLHGTGGAWMVVAADADAQLVRHAVLHSLDRKVCNTLNVCCVVRDRAYDLLPVVVAAAHEAAASRATRAVIHATATAAPFVVGGCQPITDPDLAREWEWEVAPELSLTVVDSINAAVELFNRYSPRFAASLVGGSPDDHERFYESVDAPFTCNGFTRWVDGQFAFDQPELGLSNWQAGRLLARGGVLSGDSVYTIRTRAFIDDHSLHR